MLNNVEIDEEKERAENNQKYAEAIEKAERRNMSEYIKRVEELDLSNGNISENWRRFKRNFDIFAAAIGLDEKTDVVKINTFLNAIGPNAVEVYDTFELTQMERTTYARVIGSFEEFCKARKNTVYERYIFYQRNQRDGEPFDSYLLEIKQLVRTCEFAEKENEMLRDRLVLGIADKKLQTRLLETKDLTYEIAVEKCRTNEATKQQTREMHKLVTVSEVRSQQHTQPKQQQKRDYTNNNNRMGTERERGETQQPSNTYRNKLSNHNQNNSNSENVNSNNRSHCRFCGTVHRSRECPAYGKTCHRCSKKNHFSTVCRARSVATIERVNNYVPEFGSNNNSELSSSESDDNVEFYVTTLEKQAHYAETNAEFMSPWLERVYVGKNHIAFKIDTSAEIDVLPLNLFKRLFPEIELRDANITLKAFGGQKIKPVGMCYLPCQYKNMTLNVLIAVVDIDIIPILGLTTSARFKIVNPPRTKNNDMKMNKHYL